MLCKIENGKIHHLLSLQRSVKLTFTRQSHFYDQRYSTLFRPRNYAFHTLYFPCHSFLFLQQNAISGVLSFPMMPTFVSRIRTSPAFKLIKNSGVQVVFQLDRKRLA